jgi:UPF0755 protein
MSNRQLINMLKAGNQEPVKLAFQNIRLKENFVGMVAKKIESDSLSMIRLLDSSTFVAKYGFNKDNIYVMFIPNSYELYWNTSAEKFFGRMYDEYQKFWTEERKIKAKSIGLNPIEVSILASIVDGEALHDKEMPMIAGLYMNRYNQGIALEADPTVIFANHDFTIHRVLNKHLRVESPYNTYIHKGLPPGPINMPSIKAIDAVLNYTKHNYIYLLLIQYPSCSLFLSDGFPLIHLNNHQRHRRDTCGETPILPESCWPEVLLLSTSRSL